MKTKKETWSASRFYGIPALATLALLFFWFSFREEIPLWWIITAALILLAHYALFAIKHRPKNLQQKIIGELRQTYALLRNIQD